MASQYVKLPLTGGGGGGGGAVDSFNGRTGVVVSQIGDYSAATVSNTPAGSVSATDVQAAINEIDADRVALSATVSSLSATVAGKQDLDAELTALAAISSNGLLARTGAGTAAARTLTAGSNIAVTNGDGVSGNPTVALTGQVPVANGGLGISTVPVIGAVPIGTGTGYSVAQLTAGSGINIVNASGSIILSLATTLPINIDGGAPDSVYGGIYPINGGTP